MIPLSLTLSGIYSYQQPQTIDFTRLTEASIFGIFGTVGSGKSTVLEAISYALYGETERLNQRENRGYNMMNLKSNELLIDFVFKTGESDTEYRFKVSGKRNRNTFERINTFERTAYRKEEAEWIPIEADAEPLIGLSYHNFRRTIIIPQGKFQDFLQLTDVERTRMMKELFNLDKFELYHKIVALERKNNDEILLLKDRSDRIEEVDAVQVDVLKASLQEIRKSVEAHTQVLSEKQQVDSAYAQLKELFERIEEQQALLSQLQAQEGEFSALEVRIMQFEYCQLYFKALLEGQQQNAFETQKLADALASQRKNLASVTGTLEKEEAYFGQLRLHYEKREELRQKAAELEKVALIIELEQAEAKISERLSNGELYYSKAASQVGKLTQEQAAVRQSLQLAKRNQPDMATLAALSNWFAVQRELDAVHTDLLQEEEKAKTSIRQLKDKKTQVLTPAILQGVPQATRESSVDELLQRFEEKGACLEKEINAITLTIQHLLLQSKLEEYASVLQAGHPCPLCGSSEHPHKLNASEVNQVIAEKGQQKADLQDLLGQVRQAEKHLSILATQFTTQKEWLAQVGARLAMHANKQEDHRKAFVWDAFVPEDEAKVRKAFEEAASLRKNIEEQEQTLETLRITLLEEETKREKFRTAIAALQSQKQEKTAEARVLKEQITFLEISAYVHLPPARLSRMRNTWCNNIRRSEKNTSSGKKHLLPGSSK